MADYLIGDVQGCFDALQALLKKVKFSADRDQLLFLGDIINRGNQSLQTLRFIKDLHGNAKVVLGNHDFHLLACALTQRKPSNKDTFTDILKAKDKIQLIDFLLQQPLILKHKNALLVHAGVPPLWGEKRVLKQAQIVQNHLQSEHASDFLSSMYSNNSNIWHDGLCALDQCRYTINALMRLRFCDENGKLEFHHKGNFDQAPEGYKAWFLHENRELKNTDIFFGHWSTLQQVKQPHIYPMDHGCIWKGSLSAINLDNKAITSVGC